MGGGTFDSSTYKGYTKTISSATVDEIFKKRSMASALDPRGLKVREARDSIEHPLSTPVIVAPDVTGSMNPVIESLIKEALGVFFEGMFDRKPVTDPQLLFAAVGDVKFDSCPLQVSQFESDNRITDQLTDIFIEGGGGWNNSESYNLPWYFAALHTSTDSFEKRGKRGYLFTLGDEMPPPDLTAYEIERVFGEKVQPVTNEQLLEMAGRMFHVFHVIIEQGTHCRGGHVEDVKQAWTKVLGQNVISLSDYTKLGEVLISTIQVIEGEEAERVAASWSDSTALVVRHAIGHLKSQVAVVGDNTGVVRL